MFSETLKSIQTGFSKFVTPQRMFILVVFSVLAWLLLSYSGSKSFRLDSMETGTDTAPVDKGVTAPAASIASPNELLPTDTNSQWAQLNPSGSGDLQNVNLLRAGYHMGIDTIGNTLRNANLQLRSEPANPQLNVGPWNNTTIAPDTMRTPLELGQGSQ